MPGTNTMLLKEFFSKPIEIDQNQKGPDNKGKDWEDELFWFILDHDKLQKDYFFPIAKKLKKLKECGDEMIYEMFMPMVVKGCKEFYSKKELKGRMSPHFPIEMREGLCKRLYDHYQEDVKNNKYQLG